MKVNNDQDSTITDHQHGPATFEDLIEEGGGLDKQIPRERQRARSQSLVRTPILRYSGGQANRGVAGSHPFMSLALSNILALSSALRAAASSASSP